MLAIQTPSLANTNVVSWDLSVGAFDTSIAADPSTDENAGPQANPFSFDKSITHTEGASSNTSILDFSGNGNLASFDFDLDHVRSGIRQSRAGTTGGVRFTVSENVEYDIQGMYSLLGNEEVLLSTGLVDITDDFTTFFHSLQESASTQDEVFTVGLQEGDARNILLGSPFGTLEAGHEYQFFFSYVLKIPSEAGMDDGGASASGYLNFTITPEPTSAILLALGFLAARRKHPLPPPAPNSETKPIKRTDPSPTTGNKR